LEVFVAGLMREHPQEHRPTATMTIIAKESRLKGELAGTAGVRIEGQLEGNVTVDGPVEVAEGAKVQGEIKGRTVKVAGEVVGNVQALQLVELLASASVKGDLHTPSLHVVEGAHLEGQVHMDSRPGPPAKPKEQSK
jgi:cytoskeletal protein CcmA (bactofilin family)